MKKTEILNANVKINQIEDLLKKASDILNEIPAEIQDVILNYHNEHATLQHCLRWGYTAAEEIREDWHTVVSEIKVE